MDFKEENKMVDKLLTPATLIDEQREKDFDAIKNGEAFKNKNQVLNKKEVDMALRQKENFLTNEELNREWEEYLLAKKKEQQAYTIKKEKRLIKQDVKSKIAAQKREIALNTFGYLYADDKGNIQNFVYSKSINRLRQFANWYKSLEESTRKIIKSTILLIIGLGIFAAFSVGLFKIIILLIKGGLI